MDNEVDNGGPQAARRQAAAALLEQAGALARAGAIDEAAALMRATQLLLGTAPAAPVVRIAGRGGRR